MVSFQEKKKIIEIYTISVFIGLNFIFLCFKIIAEVPAKKG